MQATGAYRAELLAKLLKYLVAELQLGDMEREVRGVRDPTRRELGNTIRQYKEALGQVQKDLDTAKGKFQRNALMSGASAGSIDVSTGRADMSSFTAAPLTNVSPRPVHRSSTTTANPSTNA